MSQNLKIGIITICIVILVYIALLFYYDKQDDLMQIANPASVFCIENGGTLDIVSEESGLVGMCHLSNGVVCDEWEYFRGECG